MERTIKRKKMKLEKAKKIAEDIVRQLKPHYKKIIVAGSDVKKIIPATTEQEIFKMIGLEVIPAQERSTETLSRVLRTSRRTVQGSCASKILANR